MTHQRYRLSFLLSTLISLVVGMGVFSLLDIEKKLQTPKKEHLVKVALLTLPKPVKKVAPTPIEPKKIVSPTPPIIKKKPKPKPITKPKKLIKKHKAKKVHKKIVKKIKPKKVHKKIIKKPKLKPRKVVEEIVTVPTRIVEQPTITTKSITRKEPKVIKSTPNRSIPTDNGREKRAFLQKVRSRIIANKKYPRIALRRHIESSIKVRFDITNTGEVSNIRFVSGKRIFYKSIKKTLTHTFPIAVPSNIRSMLPIYDVSVVLHFNIR